MVQGLKNISLEKYKNLNNNNMTKTRERNSNYLISLGRRANGEATPKVNKIITLYNQSKISQLQTAENIIIKLITAKTEKQQRSTLKHYEKLIEQHIKQKTTQEKYFSGAFRNRLGVFNKMLYL